MKKEPTYIELKDENRRLRERIAYLERMLFGSSRDRRTKPADTPEAEDQLIPGLLEEFEAALAESERKIADTKAQIAAEGERRRRQSAANPCKRGVYRYSGLEERWHTEIPEGIDCSEYDVIGRDVTRILHRVPETYWVECIERPIFRLKSERNASRARILQAPAPPHTHAVIGGSHVGAGRARKDCHGQVRAPHPGIPAGQDAFGEGRESSNLYCQRMGARHSLQALSPLRKPLRGYQVQRLSSD